MIRRPEIRASCLLLLLCACFPWNLKAQYNVAGSVTSIGYTLPTPPLVVAPGQLVTLFTQGYGLDVLRSARAAEGVRLPTTLDAMTAGMTQFQSSSAGPLILRILHLPILEVHTYRTCGNRNEYGCAGLLAITVQIPYELNSAFPPQCPRAPCAATAQLGVSEAGVGGASNDVIPVSDQIHLIRSYDPILTPQSRQGLFGPDCGRLGCAPVVIHADGTPVSFASPAQEGEELIAYAVGLGQTDPPSETGAVIKTSSPTQITFTMDFNFRPNALATKPPPLNGAVGRDNTTPVPLYTGTTPGTAGIYQVNFIVPPIPAGIPPCVNPVQPVAAANVVVSNLTVSIGGVNSFDGVGICVTAPAAPNERRPPLKADS